MMMMIIVIDTFLSLYWAKDDQYEYIMPTYSKSEEKLLFFQDSSHLYSYCKIVAIKAADM